MGDIGKTTNHLILEPLNAYEAPAEPTVAPAEGWMEKHIQETTPAEKASV